MQYVCLHILYYRWLVSDLCAYFVVWMRRITARPKKKNLPPSFAFSMKSNIPVHEGASSELSASVKSSRKSTHRVFLTLNQGRIPLPGNICLYDLISERSLENAVKKTHLLAVMSLAMAVSLRRCLWHVHQGGDTTPASAVMPFVAH